MPRDSAGNYTLPPGNPVASGEIISANWANTTMDDLGEALSASLDRYGRGGMLAPFSFADGTVSAPGATWANEPTTGFFRNGYGDLQVTITGQQMQKWTPNKSYLWRDDGEGNVGWDEILTASSTGGDITFDSLFIKNDLYVNTDQFVVDSVSGNSYFGSGNVGIGVAPLTGAPLTVKTPNSAFAIGEVEDEVLIGPTSTAKSLKLGNQVQSGTNTWMTIAADGNVGIGTSSPASVVTSASTCLHIDGGASQSASALFRTTNAQWEIGSWENVSANFGIFNNVAGSFALSIDTAGNVGIGRSPDENLTVADSGSTDRAGFRISGAASTLVLGNRNTGAGTSEITYDRSYSALTFSSGTTESLSEHMRIDGSGNVGINGTPDSGNLSGAGGAKLQVDGDGYFSGTVSAGGMALSKKDGTIGRTGASGLGLYFEGGSNNVILPTDRNGDLKSNGPSLGNGTRNFNNAHFSGTVNAGAVVSSGNVTAFSDVRLKEDIRTLDGSKVFDMRGVSFTKDGEGGSGVIAQELQQVAPELVSENGEYLSVAYGNVVGYLIEAVKGLNKRIEELEHGAT